MRAVTISTSWVIRLLRTAAVPQIDARERIIGIAHPQVVVFNTKRPVRCEAVLKSNAHGAAPAGRAGRGQFNAGKRFEDAKAVARHRRTALYVEQRCVPGVADLAGEEADTIGFGASGDEARTGKLIEKRAEARVAEIRPIALCFQAKHPLVGLPTVADLAADETSGPRAAAVSEAKDTKTIEIQAAVALTPAAIAADVEAGPVVNRGHMGAGGGALTAISAADAGAAIPRAIKPTVPNKNFFITQSPFVMRFVEANHFGTSAHRILRVL